MATADQVMALVASHYDRDEDRFKSILLQIQANANNKKQQLGRRLDRFMRQPRYNAQPLREILADGKVIKYNSDKKKRDLILEADTDKSIQRILLEYNNQEELSKYGLAPKQKLLFQGPSGTGKTLTAWALAGELGLPLCVVNQAAMFDSYVGSTSKNLDKLFEQITLFRGVYLIDEFDSLGLARDTDTSAASKEIHRALNTFLQLIEGSLGASIIIATTNRSDLLDPALMRRFDDIVHYPLPSPSSCCLLVDHLLAKYPYPNTQIDVQHVSRFASSISHALIELAFVEALKHCILQDVCLSTSCLYHYLQQIEHRNE